MPSLSPVVLALSWGVMSAFQTLQGAVVPSGGDAPVSLHAFSLNLLAAETPPWPDAPEGADKPSPASLDKTSSSMSIAMWFGVLGATLLILPRLRRR